MFAEMLEASPLALSYLTPSQVKAAYKLPSSGGAGTTIAIVDAYDDPTAASDLNVFSSYLWFDSGEFHEAQDGFKHTRGWGLGA